MTTFGSHGSIYEVFGGGWWDTYAVHPAELGEGASIDDFGQGHETVIIAIEEQFLQTVCHGDLLAQPGQGYVIQYIAPVTQLSGGRLKVITSFKQVADKQTALLQVLNYTK